QIQLILWKDHSSIWRVRRSHGAIVLRSSARWALGGRCTSTNVSNRLKINSPESAWPAKLEKCGTTKSVRNQSESEMPVGLPSAPFFACQNERLACASRALHLDVQSYSPAT